MIFRLVVLNGPTRGERITIPMEPMTIGRGEDCGLRLSDPEVAQEHAILEHTDDGLLVHDLGTMNRILVNKHEVREAHLKHGDVIEIGRTTFLVQAFVQAEISGGTPADRVRLLRKALKAAAVAAVLAPVAWYGARLAGSRSGAATGTSSVAGLPDTNAAIPVASIPPPSTAAAPSVAVAPSPVTTVVAMVPVPPAVTNAPARPIPAPADMVSEEFRRLREELAVIKEAVKNLPTQTVAVAAAPPPATAVTSPPPATGTASVAVATAPPPPTNASPEATNAPPPIVARPAPAAEDAAAGAAAKAAERLRRSEDALRRARASLASGQPDEAERQLLQLQKEDPGFLAAYEEGARLYEQQGHLDKAISQWSQLIQHNTSPPLAEKAAGEWARLSADLRQKSAPPPRRLKISGVSQHRFPESTDYDEMRVVRIGLASVGGAPPAADQVRVEVSFFDRDADSGEIVLSRALPPRTLISAEGEWSEDGARTLNATYLIPRGFRERVRSGEEFYGFVVRLMLNGLLQDEEARPTDLLRQTPGETAAGGGGAQDGS